MVYINESNNNFFQKEQFIMYIENIRLRIK